MKKFLYLFIGASLLFVSCNKDDDDMTTGIPPGEGNVELQSEVNEFIWRGLNHWYFWQGDQQDLADDRFADTDFFYEYLNGFSDSEDLFNSLLYMPDVVDDFSWYIDDVDEQLNSFRGISESYGINFPRPAVFGVSSSSNDVVVLIGYVVPDSPADRAGLKRGDLVYKVDGVQLTTEDFSAINNLFTNTSISLEIATVENQVLVPVAGEFSMTPELLTNNPVHYFDTIEEGGKKIGYLVYNGFRNTFNGELNEVFGFFKSENIDELILDMRYNGGGSVLTSAFLSSMINGNIPAQNDTYARSQYNEKRDAERGFSYPFFDEVILYDKTTSDQIGTEDINRLNTLNRLYVIATGRTASASEMIINGLRPYMDVILVGETTVGKNEGSITVVDSASPYVDLENRNPNHTVGMQPIVFQVFNSLDQSDYTFGFEPDQFVSEADSFTNILPFGDTNEVMLRATLDLITGATGKSQLNLNSSPKPIIHENGIRFPKFTDEMYLDKPINLELK